MTDEERRPKIAACIIAYNCEKDVPDLLNSLEGQVDYIVVGVDPKTNDDTKRVITEWAEQSPTLVTMFDGKDVMVDGFHEARNQTFYTAPDDADWLLWIDTDDILAGDVNLHDLCAEQGEDVAAIWLPYIYHRDKYGNTTTLFDRERVMSRRHAPIWKGTVHETCEPRIPGKYVRSEKVWVDQIHVSDSPKGERNFALLRAAIEADPNDHRAVLYLAHQHFAAHEWTEACEQYEKFINLRSAGDVLHEKWQACIYLAKARRENGEIAESVKAANAALQMCPEFADSYFELAHSYAINRQWQKAIEWHEMGLTKKQPDRILINNPLDYEFNPFAVIHTAYAAVGRYTDALDALTKCLDLRPNEQEFRIKGAHYLAEWERKKAIVATLQAARYLVDRNETLKAEALLDSLPSGAAEENPEVLAARAEVASRVAHLRDKDAYENFYFEVPEVIPMQGDRDDLPKVYPRMDWVRRRLIECGAKKVLELGIGNGTQSAWIAHAGIQVVGVDIDPKRVRAANFAAAEQGLIPWMTAPEHTPPRDDHPVVCGHDDHIHGDECFDEKREIICETHAHVSACRHADAWVDGCEQCGEPMRLPDLSGEPVIQFHYGDATDLPERVKALGPFDAIIAAEIIEHLEDPEAFVSSIEKTAPRVLITTPDGGYKGPMQKNPSHVRAWSQKELERLLLRHGRLIESRIVAHPIPWEQGNLVAEYVVGEDTHDRPPVAIFCGPGLEPWSPDSLETGIGGSETAVIHLARELAWRGMRVAVYAEAEGVWDGVTYRHWRKFSPDMPVWTLISWRHPDVFDHGIAANLKVLWMHDTDHGDQITERRMEQVDTVLCLSEWHKQHLSEMYPFLADKLVIIGNGVDPALFRGLPERDLNRVIYASSPDRGLEQVLNYWPRVREIRPEATLHIFYGWDNYDRMGGPRAFKNRILRLAKQPGVEWHGRVGQKQVAQEYAKSSALFYPGPHDFCETFCISVVEAAAAGCVPVTRDNGALPETNAYGPVIPNDAPPERWVAALVEAMNAGKRERKRISKEARQVDWQAVARRVVARLMGQTKKITDRAA